MHLFGESLGALAGGNAFGDHLHVTHNLGERFALADAFADVTVAAMLGKAGDDQVAHSGEACECMRIRSHRAT